jgi:hypothetical protein
VLYDPDMFSAYHNSGLVPLTFMTNLGIGPSRAPVGALLVKLDAWRFGQGVRFPDRWFVALEANDTR